MSQSRIKNDRIKAVWKKYVNEGEMEDGLLRRIIADSWIRSREKYKVDPYNAVPLTMYKGEKLEKHLAKLENIIEISIPVMQNLYNFVSDGRFVLSLADSQGCILCIIGNEGVKENAESGIFVPGAVWSEEVIGTNAIGTALYLKEPVQILGREHYRRVSGNWSCSAAPIRDPHGEVLGVLGILGPYEEVHTHTLGMVVTAVNAIENQASLRVANNYKSAIIDSISEGILAIDNKGTITHINNTITKFFGINAKDVLNKNLKSLIGEKNISLLDIIKQNKFVTDYEIDIYGSKGKTTCLVTSRSIRFNEEHDGIVLVTSEISRAQKLVQRMSGVKGLLTFANLIGNNPDYLSILELGHKAATNSSSVLLLGESGTGKDVFAQSIHNTGPRKRGPFVAINCGAIPRELIASELFGYAEGAFTGATRGGKMGKFELGNGGTIFLDEIGEMPLELQTVLLRVLETKTITRVGGNETIPVDVRIIAATNRDLSEEINRGRFRQDLFYRLNVFTIKMIPLRKRKDDIPLLVEHFINDLCAKYKRPVIKVCKEVIEIFELYQWPGNIRELQNALERSINICEGDTLMVEHLPEEIRDMNKSIDLLPVNHYERDLIKELLNKHNGNITKVAKELGIARPTVYRKISKYRLDDEVRKSNS